VVHRLAGPWFAVLLVPAFCSALKAGLCTSANNFDLGDHLPKPSLGIHVFDLNLQPDFPLATMERVRKSLADVLRARLAESGYFGTVSILPVDSERTADFTMVGAFTQAKIGTNQFNLYEILTLRAVDRPSTLSVVAGIIKGPGTDPATTFQCQLNCCSVKSKYGIPPPMRTGVGKMDALVKDIASDLKAVYVQKEKLRRKALKK
jgi:hypothetical protein